ncbi:MAG: beta-lactamase family protein [Bacteriovoracaceae bacterium]|nr:beta-lactamase family protein [Bacteriovoracaceae bacterium]
MTSEIKILHDELRTSIDQMILTDEFPDTGVSISIVSGKAESFTYNHGYSNQTQKKAVTNSTIFLACSLTKSFVATALLMLEEKKHIFLDKPLGNQIHLQDKTISDKLTLIDILSHRTGLPSNDLFWLLRSFNGYELREKLKSLDLISNSFRQTFIYNNLLYSSLNHALEDLTGEPLESFIVREIFTPLKMNLNFSS